MLIQTILELDSGFVFRLLVLGDREMEQVNSATPMKCTGTPEGMEKTVLFMASDDSSFMNGNSLVVDSGYTPQ